MNFTKGKVHEFAKKIESELVVTDEAVKLLAENQSEALGKLVQQQAIDRTRLLRMRRESMKDLLEGLLNVTEEKHLSPTN